MKNRSLRGGYLLVQALVFGAIGLLLFGGLISWGRINLRGASQFNYREQAFEIAEAGIDYYRWHLAHAPLDFKDGTTGPGPYVHNFYNKDGVLTGTFSLAITAPPTGSTVVMVRSTGATLAAPTVTRTIEVKFAIPSLAKFAVAANAAMRFGEGTEVFGPIHSNNGIRFDGLAHNLVTGALASYDDPDHSGADEFGVHTHVTAPPGSGTNDAFRALEAPPTNPVPVRSDVFQAGRQFPVPAVDFNGFTADLATIKSQAQSAGRYFANSGRQGYKVVLKTNDTFDVYKVRSTVNPSGSCNDELGQAGWGSWSVNQTDSLLGNYAFPANGLLFFEDNIWVEGQINGARLTIASARFPESSSTNTSITVNNNLLYTNYDGTDVVSLVAQNNINVGMVSADTLRIDAALLAKNGRVGRYFYESGCSPYDNRSTITLYGMIATNQRYGFAYTDGSGYATRNIIYDGNLLYGPPPSFPLTSDQYITISWREI
jgi:hypothetical protein